MRPSVPEDGAALVAMKNNADPDEMQQRLMARAGSITDAEIAALATVDYVRDFVLLAWSENGALVGTASYRCVPIEGAQRSALVALAIHREWRGVGLGSELLWSLAIRAEEVGIERFTSMFRPDNESVRGLIERAGAQVFRHGDLLAFAVAPVGDVSAGTY